MQSRVVGQMRSWRGRGRRGNNRDDVNRAGDAGIVSADGGSDAAMTDDAPAARGALRTGAGNETEEEADRIARGAGVKEQIDRGAEVREQNRPNVPEQARVGTPEQARLTLPERGVNVPEYSRVPSWLQTGAAWSWRLLVLALAIYLITRLLGILYIVVVPCIAALLLTALLQPLTGRLRRAGLPALA